jgi:hypothetical protein
MVAERRKTNYVILALNIITLITAISSMAGNHYLREFKINQLISTFDRHCEAATEKYDQIALNKESISVLNNHVSYIKDLVEKIYKKVG